MDKERIELEIDMFCDWLIIEKQDVYVYTEDLTELLQEYMNERSSFLSKQKEKYPSIYEHIL